jgi:hypothetical protein
MTSVHRLMASGMIGLLLSAVPLAHDLAQSSAVVTVRDTGVIEIRLAVPYEEALHAATMPRQPQGVFLASFSSGSDRQAAAVLAAFNVAVQRGVRIVADGQAVALGDWQFPAQADVRATLRRAAMMATVGAHDHVDRLMVTATGRASGPVRQVQVQLPPALGPALLTVLHPREQWLRDGRLSPPVLVP